VTASFVIRPPVPPSEFAWASLLAGLAVVRTLRRIDLDPQIKWPNDVLLEDVGGVPVPEWGTSRKVSGILCEAIGAAVVVGIGINVSQDEDELPVRHATSLALAGSSELDRAAIITGLASEVAAVLGGWGRGSVEGALGRAVAAACDTIGQEVTVRRSGKPPLEGVATGLAPDGALLVETVDGRVESIVAGDVTLRDVL
jgi:BirA family biotin operon repressor/biotin-[acetyl-CoA-carboxylase] ligase